MDLGVSGQLGQERLCLVVPEDRAVNVVKDQEEIPFEGTADEVDLVGGAAEGALVLEKILRDGVQDVLDGEARKESVDDQAVLVLQHLRVEVLEETLFGAQAEGDDVKIFLEKKEPLVKLSPVVTK